MISGQRDVFQAFSAEKSHDATQSPEARADTQVDFKAGFVSLIKVSVTSKQYLSPDSIALRRIHSRQPSAICKLWCDKKNKKSVFSFTLFTLLLGCQVGLRLRLQRDDPTASLLRRIIEMHLWFSFIDASHSFFLHKNVYQRTQHLIAISL